MALPDDPAERLAHLRGHMQGAEVPVALFAWMKEVEDQLVLLRRDARSGPTLRERLHGLSVSKTPREPW